MTYKERKALVRYYLGKTVTISMDRPMGYVHHKKSYTLRYPINYGYLPGVIGGDGEELDVYLLGVDHPVDSYTAKIIGIIHRLNDAEDKLVAAPAKMKFNQVEIAQAVAFQEQYYRTRVEPLYHRSCGALLYRMNQGKREYLIVLQRSSGTWSVPKGHMEVGETEEMTALRECKEEVGICPVLRSDFRTEIKYSVGRGYKQVVLFAAEIQNPVISTEACMETYRFADAQTAKGLLHRAYGTAIDLAEKQLG